VPASFGWQPEDGEIFVAVLGGVGALRFVLDEPFALGIGEAEQQLLAFLLEGVGDVFQEDEAEAESFGTDTIGVQALPARRWPGAGLRSSGRSRWVHLSEFCP
jgi:hypothetical protein